MSESIPVRCPACGRAHRYTSPPYPCVCGTSVAAPLDPQGTARAVTHRAWDEEWVTVRCGTCGRTGEWPRPELGCPCGTTLCPPLAEEETDRPRRSFRPVTIRTARDAVTTAALYLDWLGYKGIRRADQRPPSGIGLAARGVLAQVDPTVRPASPRDVECLWLTAMTESATCVYFSLAGFTEGARDTADTLGVPLFTLDLTGTPQPVNAPAEDLSKAGAA
ncbi:hypothetical protein ACIQAC_15100 [Streptomyces sp. NPDC088387]|uniref:hypothetical protein n=1 Tax=Streptomyces sp. NPDC088387 TaxID=3365859 RepID=UPI003823C78B